MKFNCLLFILSILIFQPVSSQNDFYFPEDLEFDDKIPSPSEFLGYEIGEWHTRHARLVSYMEKLAEISPNAQIQTIGYTHEMRPQIILSISSVQNLNNLESIRKQHLEHAKPEGKKGNIEQMPVIVHLGYNVHGNEPSSSEVSMLIAYYLLAAKDPEVKEYLEKGIFHIEPALNPDGRDRHTTWVNSNKGIPAVADNWDREHNEAWPSGRTNHYYFDLNRDWLPLTQVESQNRVRFYHQWLPNMVTDYHEMGSSSTYFFEPTKKYGSENPIVPRYNYDTLNEIFAEYHAEALNEIGSLYFTGERFDNSYPGYGSTYPDLHGGLGVVFEQASSRGHVQETGSENITFPFSIRNHLRTSIATIKASVENKELMLEWQRKFFQEVQKAGLDSGKVHVYGDSDNPTRTQLFTQLLLDHNIEVFKLTGDITVGDKKYSSENAYAVPEAQAQNLMVKSVFDKVTRFTDSVFYDTSAWSMALAYNMKHSVASARKVQLGEMVQSEDLKNENEIPPMASYAYILDWSQMNAPSALYKLLKQKVNVKIAFAPFSVETQKGKTDFGYGSLMISVADQLINAKELHDFMAEVAREKEVQIGVVNSGRSLSGIDLGSPNFADLELPKLLMLTGEGTSSYEVGEIWFMLDKYLKMPVTKVDITDFKKIDLSNYDRLIMVSGNYKVLDTARIKNWISSGGVLITQRTATEWAIKNGIADAKLKKAEKKSDSLKRMDFSSRRNYYGSRTVGGSFYEVDLDISHPLAFGYKNRELPVYKNSSVFIEQGTNPFHKVSVFKKEPYLSGYIHPKNLDLIRNSVNLLVEEKNKGAIIMFSDNPNFRAMMLGTHRLFQNAIFFGGLIN